MTNTTTTDERSAPTFIQDTELMSWIYDNYEYLAPIIEEIEEKYDGEYELAGIHCVLHKKTEEKQ